MYNLDYKDVKNLKVGDTFYEQHMGEFYPFKVLSIPIEMPVEINGKPMNQLSWKAEYIGNGTFEIYHGKITNFLITKELAHYSPRLFTKDPGVAQQVEQSDDNRPVGGSTPSARTNTK